jgi:hypothetical protein
MSLNPFQQNTADAARAALDDQTAGHEAADLAGRCGRLEWHMAELLELVAELAGGEERGSAR